MARRAYDVGCLEGFFHVFLPGALPDHLSAVQPPFGHDHGAFAHGKPCYGVKTDVRAAERGMDLNPMLTGCFTRIFSAEEKADAFAALSEYIDKFGL